MKNKTMRLAMIALAFVALVTPFATANARQMKNKKGNAKPTVVLLHADWCGACKKLAPTFAELKQQYGDRLNFVELDVTNEATTARAATQARQLGIGKFFNANQKKSSLVAIVGAKGKVLFHTHYSMNREGAFARETYVRAFDAALAKS
ncbi:MAG: thioredoxin domain-containing protein [Pyrinomonadaceae bacterium]